LAQQRQISLQRVWAAETGDPPVRNHDIGLSAGFR
jgi:hypothetical protein